MALHLEDGGVAVADIDHPGIFARPADHPRRLRRKLFQMDSGALVAAMLRPHDREDAQLDQLWLPPQRLQDALIFLGRKTVLSNGFGRDAGRVQHFHARAPSGPSAAILDVVPDELLPGPDQGLWTAVDKIAEGRTLG